MNDLERAELVKQADREEWTIRLVGLFFIAAVAITPVAIAMLGMIFCR